MTKEQKGQLFASILLTVWIAALIWMAENAGLGPWLSIVLFTLWLVGVVSVWTS